MLIGLTGKKCSGKSTSAALLRDAYGFIELSFADPLKRGLIEIFDLPREALFGTEDDKNKIEPFWGISGRRVAQLVGTELFRDYLSVIEPRLSNIWIRRMKKEMDKYRNMRIVISDCRFEDEVSFIRKNGGIIIKIERPQTDQNIDQHISENQSIVPDFIIYNNETINELHEQLHNILKMNSFHCSDKKLKI